MKPAQHWHAGTGFRPTQFAKYPPRGCESHSGGARSWQEGLCALHSRARQGACCMHRLHVLVPGLPAGRGAQFFRQNADIASLLNILVAMTETAMEDCAAHKVPLRKEMRILRGLDGEEKVGGGGLIHQQRTGFHMPTESSHFRKGGECSKCLSGKHVDITNSCAGLQAPDRCAAMRPQERRHQGGHL